ncbi:hypothetical protein LCGC14_1725800, partial [marine sediment metagenome]
KSGSFISVENLTAPVYIGRYDTKYANGLIDNVMFFGAELTPDEVHILFNAGSGTENVCELDQEICPRRSNLSVHAQRRRFEFA